MGKNGGKRKTMNNYGDSAPIKALATPAGRGALALIRTSGENSIELLASMFSRPQTLKNAAGNTVVWGWIIDENGRKVDETLVSVYRAPKSYTGEDGADISCHGGGAVVNAVLQTLDKAGFRDALPGEFAFRAFINGKIGLTQAESVMELVSARTAKGRESAIRRLSGELETEIREIKGLLVNVLAGTELFLDYSEDEFAESNAAERDGRLPEQESAKTALRRLSALSAAFSTERLYQEGALAVIAGKPNAGKSSLFNRLLREDRAIVAEAAGTTRDWIEAFIDIAGVPVRLIDTAGLRETDNIIEKIGVERSKTLVKEADALIYVIDGELGIAEEDTYFLETAKIQPILVWNKVDIAETPAETPELLGISAKTGRGIAELTNALAKTLLQSAVGDAQVLGIASQRQKILVDNAKTAMENALSLADKKRPLDLIAPILRESINYLGEITGEVSTADILETMFSQFCVGK
jgi:tRNA modification GTPase